MMIKNLAMGTSPERTRVAVYGCTNVARLSPLREAPRKFKLVRLASSASSSKYKL